MLQPTGLVQFKTITYNTPAAYRQGSGDAKSAPSPRVPELQGDPCSGVGGFDAFGRYSSKN